MDNLTAQQYFDKVKENKNKITDEDLLKVYENACAYSLVDDYKRYRLIAYAKNTKYNYRDLEPNEMRYRFNKFCKSLIN